MGRMIKYEIYKLTHSPLALALLPASVFVYVLILCFNSIYISGHYAFFYCISNPIPIMWISVILAACLLGSEYHSRTVNAPVYSGVSRLNILVTKTLCYFIIIILIGLISLITALILYSFNFKELINNGPLIKRLGLWLLLTLGTASFPLFFNFVFRDIFMSMGVSAVFTYLMQQLFGYTSENPGLDAFIKYYPPYLQMNIMQIGEGIPAYLFLTAPLVCIFISLLISYSIFNNRRLK